MEKKIKNELNNLFGKYDYSSTETDIYQSLSKLSPILLKKLLREAQRFREKSTSALTSFLINAPEMLITLTRDDFILWAETALDFSQIDYQTASLFFKYTKKIILHRTKKDFKKFKAELINICTQSPLVSRDFLEIIGIYFSDTQISKIFRLLDYIKDILKKDIFFAEAYSNSAKKLLNFISTENFLLWTKIILLLNKRHIEFIEKSPNRLAELDKSAIDIFLLTGYELTKLNQDALIPYLLNVKTIYNRTGSSGFRIWVMEGLRETSVNPEYGTLYFNLRLSTAVELFYFLDSSIDTFYSGRLLSLFGYAVSQGNMKFSEASKFKDYVETGFIYDRIIYLPSKLNIFPDKDKNLKFYFLKILHDTAHFTYGTFSKIKKIKKVNGKNIIEHLNVKDIILNHKDREFFGNIFEIIEDARVDLYSRLEYPALKESMKYFFRESLTGIFTHDSWKNPEEEFLRRLVIISVKPSKVSTALTKPEKDLIKLLTEFYKGKLKLSSSIELSEKLYKYYKTKWIKGKKIHTYKKRHINLSYRSPIIWEDPQKNEKNKKAQLIEKTQEISEAISEHSFLYREWDGTKYLENWCYLAEKTIEIGQGDLYERILNTNQDTIRRIKNQFQLLEHTKLKRERYLLEGDEIDPEAVYNYVSDIKIGIVPDERIYMRKRKLERDIGTAFLLDISNSTTGKINGKMVLDIEKEAAVLMIEALEELNDHYGIFSFSSYGRKKNNFFILKDFNEHFSDFVKYRINSLVASGNTRMGTAIRHSIFKLRNTGNNKRLLIIISDGKPWDFDYEHRYAEEDTKKALYEAKRNKINIFFINIKKGDIEYFSRVFGKNNFIVLQNALELPAKLPQIYKKLTL